MAGSQVSEELIEAAERTPGLARTVRFTRTFAAAHRLADDPGKCQNVHGHNYRVSVAITAWTELDGSGFIVPFDLVKEVIDRNDHALILDRDDSLLASLADIDIAIRVTKGPPSTERLAQALAEEILAVTDPGTRNVEVEIWLRETEGIEAHGIAAS
jgi:6-pyruvoyltetrahydropterin/6-carboxytetrahydropterin synthase